MSTGEAFSSVTLPDIGAGTGSSSGEDGLFPWFAAEYEEATGVTLCESRTEWLAEAHKKLSRFASLTDNWDSYGAQTPNPESVRAARQVLRALASTDFEPTSIDPSAEGGVCISFQQGDQYGDVECFNTGELFAITSSGDETNVWEIDDLEQCLDSALNKILAFVSR